MIPFAPVNKAVHHPPVLCRVSISSAALCCGVIWEFLQTVGCVRYKKWKEKHTLRREVKADLKSFDLWQWYSFNTARSIRRKLDRETPIFCIGAVTEWYSYNEEFSICTPDYVIKKSQTVIQLTILTLIYRGWMSGLLTESFVQMIIVSCQGNTRDIKHNKLKRKMWDWLQSNPRLLEKRACFDIGRMIREFAKVWQ